VSHWFGTCHSACMTQTQNARTLIATFDDYSTARQAERELEGAGVPSTDIHLVSNRKTAGAGSAQYQDRHESGLKEWWDSLFGTNNSEDDRRAYESAISRGSTVLRVTMPAEGVDRAADILNHNGAKDVERSGGTATTERTATRTNRAETAGKGPVQVVEEELQVGKRAVQRGGVRVYSHVVSQPVEQEVRLREEHVNVERRKVDREISPNEVNALRDQTIEVTEMAEEPIIAKRARVREEVVVGKEATERTQTVRDNVRHTEVEVEPLGTNQTSRAGAQDYTEDYRRDFRQRYGSDADFATMRPAYEYGYRTASDPRYRGRSWDQVESDLRTDYERSNPNSKWEQAKQSIRYGWDKMTGKA
jgi:uncharacterized protein (TIGR02271 family)